MRILVTGATGFVGAALLQALAGRGMEIVAARRDDGQPSLPTVDAAPIWVRTGEIDARTDWREALAGVEAVVHLAGLAHRRRARAADYARTNVEGSARLAEQAAAAGVHRFVFVSTAKVHGERSVVDSRGEPRPFRESDPPAPADAYARSKWDAEQGLRAIERRSGLAVSVLRPPLVYGPGVRANFAALLRAIARGWPLPVGRIDNRRSLVFVGNLVSAIERCMLDGRAAGGTFLVSDGEDLSTPALIRRLGVALNRPARVFDVPVPALRLLARLSGREAALGRLTDSMLVDGTHLRLALDWQPPFTLATGLELTASWYAAAAPRP
ncbi:MAG: NAD-dependent epimerase/dehydratase family protein [Gammaproteobacteria bacterium]|nr:NAD-dependent epimerase/dehydratase family protein [Gammaproteobacteria bacterium]